MQRKNKRLPPLSFKKILYKCLPKLARAIRKRATRREINPHTYGPLLTHLTHSHIRRVRLSAAPGGVGEVGGCLGVFGGVEEERADGAARIDTTRYVTVWVTRDKMHLADGSVRPPPRQLPAEQNAIKINS